MKPVKFKGFVIKAAQNSQYEVYNKQGMKMNFYLPLWMTHSLETIKQAVKDYLICKKGGSVR